MYYAIFKRFGKNKYYYLGVSKNKLDASNYDLFSQKNDDSKYVYFELDGKDLEKLDLTVNALYLDKNGLVKYVKKEPIAIPYPDFREINALINKINKKYNISRNILFPFDEINYYITRDKMHEDELTKDENKTKVIWYAGDKGVGKTYLLNAIKETFDRPSIIIDCSTLADNEERFIYQEIYERLLREFDEDVDSINNAIIMLDNVDKVKVKDRHQEDFFWSIQREFKNVHYQKYYSKEFGEGRMDINNAIIICTSTVNSSIYKDQSDLNFFTKELVEYVDIKFDKEACNDYLNSELSCLKILEKYYKVFGTTLVFKEPFIEELINRVLTLGEGYNGFRMVLNPIINEELKKYSKVTFYSFDNIEYENKLINEVPKVYEKKLK